MKGLIGFDELRKVINEQNVANILSYVDSLELDYLKGVLLEDYHTEYILQDKGFTKSHTLIGMEDSWYLKGLVDYVKVFGYDKVNRAHVELLHEKELKKELAKVTNMSEEESEEEESEND